jgi:rhomboid-related protein 1/2/3
MLVSVIEIVVFVYHLLTNPPNSSVPIDSIFIYRPDKKQEIWRFLLYMLLHAGWFHLTFNLIVQILIGIPLEMVHGSGRIACIYLAGVLAGSLGTSIFDSNAYLVGSSGGVYALLAAHLANIMLNYSNMEYGIVRLLAILLFGECESFKTPRTPLTFPFSPQLHATSASPFTPATKASPSPTCPQCLLSPTSPEPLPVSPSASSC